MNENTAKVVDFEIRQKDGETPAELPGVDASLIATLPGDRQVQLRTAFLQESSVAQINATFDKLFAALDRQKARYELVDLKKELRVHRKTLERQTDDITRLDERHDVKMAEINTEIETLQADSGKITDEAQKQHVRRGKQAAFEPVGHVKASLDRMQTQIVKLVDRRTAAENERAAAKQNFATSAARFQEEIDNLEREIAEREALLKA